MIEHRFAAMAGAVALLAGVPVAARAQDAAAPAEAPEENLLAAPEESPAEEERGRATLAGAAEESEQSFGATLDALGVEPTWSGYGDLVGSIDEEGEGTFDQTHFNPIIGARLGKSARAELELEIEHGGEEFKAEYAFFELELAEPLSLRAGKFLIPIGHFNDVLHPSFRWSQISRPSMFREVVPAVWSDVGVEAFGRVRLGASASFAYAAYVVNGLGMREGLELTAQEEPVRKLRDTFVDTNADKGLGSRVGLRLFQGGPAEVEAAFSGYTGAIDADGALRLTILDADLALKLGDLILRGEVAQSYLGTDDAPLEPFERGSYVQLGYQLGKVKAALRWDNTLQKPALGPATIENQLVPSLLFAPEPVWSVRAEARLPFDRDGNPGDRSYAAMVAFMF